MSSEVLVAPWSGPLKTKKKAELQQICRQLAIDYKSDSLKADLELQIRKRFKENPSLQDDERFIKLDHNSISSSPNGASSRRSNRARSVSRQRESDVNSRTREPENDELDLLKDPFSRSPRPRKSIASEVSTNSEPPLASTVSEVSTNAEHSAPQQILVTLINPEQGPKHQTVSKPHTDPTKECSRFSRLVQQTHQQVLDSFNTFARHANCYAFKIIQAIQTTFSTPWKLCIIAVLLELIFVIYSTMPLRPKISVHSQSDHPSVRVAEPLIRLFDQIISKSFLRPFIYYLSLTVMLPFMVSGLMNVPSSRQQQERNEQNVKSMRDLKPSVFLYCATRLTVLALVHLVFYPSYRFGWPHPTLHLPSSLPPSPLKENQAISQSWARNFDLSGLESVQYITTAFTMAISLHQLIHSNP